MNIWNTLHIGSLFCQIDLWPVDGDIWKMKDMRIKRVKIKSQVLVISECCSPAMFEKKILWEQTATTAELIIYLFYVTDAK